MSRGAYEGLNLALHVGDESRSVRQNRARLAAEIGAPVWFPDQVHGSDVVVVDGPPGDSLPAPRADALVAARPGVAVGVLVADCVPVLLADSTAGIVAAVHAGRRGLVAGVVEAAVQAMTGSGARADRIRAAVGPAAGGCCYEVPADMQDDVAGRLPATRSQTTWGTPSLDLRGGVVQVLGRSGVADVHVVGTCTIEDPDAYSHRRSTRTADATGASTAGTGRFAGVVLAVP